MTTGKETPPVVTPSSISVNINQFHKEPHHCKFEDCQNERRGYNDFCREHKAIGKIISGRIAREKAIAKIAARDKTNHAIEVDPSLPTPIKPYEGLDILSSIGLLIIIVGFFVYVNSISTTGWFVPTVPEWADFMCISSVSVGSSLILFNQVLDRKNSKSVEVKNEKLPVVASNSISIELNQFQKKESHVCIFGDCKKGKRGGTEYCRDHKSFSMDKTDALFQDERNSNEISLKENWLETTAGRITLTMSGVGLILYSWFSSIPNSFDTNYSPIEGCFISCLGCIFLFASARGIKSFLLILVISLLVTAFGFHLMWQNMPGVGGGCCFGGWSGP